MKKKCKHEWNLEGRKNGKEAWSVCSKCGFEKQVHIVSIEPLKGGSGTETRRKRMSTSEIDRRFDEIEKDDSEY